MSNVTISKFSDGTNIGYIAPQAYFVSTSLADASAKTATSADSIAFTNTSLVSGVTVWVKFTYPNMVYVPTLKIGTSTAKTVKGDTYWNAGDVVSFTYDGTNWCRNGEAIPYFTGILNVSFDNIRTGISDYGVITLDNSYTVYRVFETIRNYKKPCYISVTNGTDRCVLLSEGYMQENGLDDWINAIITFRSVSRRMDSDSDTTGYFEAVLPSSGQFRLYYRKNVIYGNSTNSTTNALAKCKNTNGEIIPGPTLGSTTTTFLRNDVTWAAPPTSTPIYVLGTDFTVVPGTPSGSAIAQGTLTSTGSYPYDVLKADILAGKAPIIIDELEMDPNIAKTYYYSSYNGASYDELVFIAQPDDDTYTDCLFRLVIGSQDDYAIYQIDLGDRIWRESTNGAVYYPKTLKGESLGNGTLAIATSNNANVNNVIQSTNASILLLPGFNVTVASAAAGSTTYTISSGSSWILGNGSVSYMTSLLFFCEASAGAQQPTSATVNGSSIVLTFATSLNPTAATTLLRWGIKSLKSGAIAVGSGITSNAQSAITVGYGVENAGSYTAAFGAAIQNTGSASLISGSRHYNTGKRSQLLGQNHVNTKDDAFLAGNGHNSSSGVAGVAAVGNYSSIASDTAFAVGIGTADNARANAFVVHTDGRATITTAPTANMDVANKSYVDNSIATSASSHTHGNITNDGKIGTTANYAVYTTTGGALTASAALPTATTNATIAALPVWSAAPTDTTYLIRQDTGGSSSFGRVPFSTVNTYIKTKNLALNYITYDSTEDAIKFVFPS